MLHLQRHDAGLAVWCGNPQLGSWRSLRGLRRTKLAAGTPAAGASHTVPEAFPFTPVLNDIRIVLVAPRVPANIGAVARVCANFEAPDLWVVAPRCDPQDGEVQKVACGEAILRRMRVVGTLEEALADTSSSVGFTRRAGATRVTHSSISDMLREFPGSIPGMVASPPGSDAAAGGVTALVFGREESGLSEAEVRLCAHACALPTGRIQPSMNLSHAVGVVTAELFARRTALTGDKDLGLELLGGSTQDQPGLQPVSAGEVNALLAKVAGIARAVGVRDEESSGGGNQGNHGRRRLPLGHIRALLARAKPNTWEVRSLHKLASAVLAAVGGTMEAAPLQPVPPRQRPEAPSLGDQVQATASGGRHQDE